MSHELKLYHYWRSSSSWRVRWALEIKKVKYESIAVNLLKKEQQSAEYITKNASGFVPCLEIDGQPYGESLAIIEWLEEQYPNPSLLPKNPSDKLKVRQLAFLIACGTQPLQNLSAQVYYSADKEKRKEYAQYWINAGFKAYEATMSTTSKYSYGDTVSLADLCLLPQCYNALRFEVQLQQYPNILRVYNNCLELESYQNSHPDKQPGAITQKSEHKLEKIINNKRFTIATAITYTITLIIVSAPYTVEHLKYLGRENGVFEYSSNVGYVIAMIMALIMGLYLREKKVVAWITLFALMLMRECNLHKLFTKRSMFGDGFYLSSDIPVEKKIIGAVICVGMIIFFSSYMYKYAKSFVLQYRKSPWGFSVLCAIVCVLMSVVVDKLVHRLVKKLHGSLQTCKMCIALEEGIELFIPIAFVIAMIQYFYDSKKN